MTVPEATASDPIFFGFCPTFATYVVACTNAYASDIYPDAYTDDVCPDA